MYQVAVLFHSRLAQTTIRYKRLDELGQRGQLDCDALNALHKMITLAA